MSSSDSIFNFGLLALAAYVLWSMGLFEKPKEKTAAESAITAVEASNDPWLKKIYEEKYLKETCSWYDRILDPIGCAVKDTVGAPKPSPVAGTEHSPQTPQPKTDICPYDSGLLAGDRRCNPQSAHEARGEFVFGR